MWAGESHTCGLYSIFTLPIKKKPIKFAKIYAGYDKLRRTERWLHINTPGKKVSYSCNSISHVIVYDELLGYPVNVR